MKTDHESAHINNVIDYDHRLCLCIEPVSDALISFLAWGHGEQGKDITYGVGVCVCVCVCVHVHMYLLYPIS